MIYFDNSATTQPCKKALDAYLSATYGNPSSRHGLGIEAAKLLEESRKKVADVLGVSAQEIYFTNGGTLADNIAILGGADIHKGKRVVTTAIEHPAVLQCMKELDSRGFEIVYIQPDATGDISKEKIQNALSKDTCLVSIMHVNNETGAILPIERVRELMNKICPDALFHTDAVQSFGKIPLYPAKWGIDMVSVSSHKIHGVKGAGALYVRRGVNIKSTVFGGGQEKNIVSGTQNLPAIAAFAAACEEIDFSFDFAAAKYLLTELSKIKGVVLNRPQNALPSIINLSFGNIPSEVTLNALSAEEVYISAGSACSSSKAGKSHVLKEMGSKNAAGAVRISLSKYNTVEEAEQALLIIKKTLIPLMEALS